MAKIDESRLLAIASLIASSPAGVDPDFTWPNLPAVGAARKDVINFFFVWALMQWGFWHVRKNRYERPLYGLFEGNLLKGADLMTSLLYRKFDQDPTFFEPHNLANLSWEDFVELFTDDNGPVPLLATMHRLEMLHKMSTWFVLGFNPETIVRAANTAQQPLKVFRGLLRDVPGFSKDPLEKRSLLLAMVLSNRPEKFLRIDPAESFPPIVDYHLMRLMLRMGVVVPDRIENYFLVRRKLIPDFLARLEGNIRTTTRDAIQLLVDISGRNMAAVDQLLWQGRRYCPEMTLPTCSECIFNPGCVHNIELFQPVYMTDYY